MKIILSVFASSLYFMCVLCHAAAMAQLPSGAEAPAQEAPLRMAASPSSWPNYPKVPPTAVQHAAGLTLQKKLADESLAAKTLTFSLQLTASILGVAGQHFVFTSSGMIDKAGRYALTVTTGNDVNALYCDGRTVTDVNAATHRYCSVPIRPGAADQDAVVKQAVQSADPPISSASVFADAALSVYFFATGGILSSPNKSITAYPDTYDGKSVIDLVQTDSNGVVSTSIVFGINHSTDKAVAIHDAITRTSLNMTAVNDVTS